VEVAGFEVATAGSMGESALRRMWAARQINIAAPLLLVVDDYDRPGDVLVLGPRDDRGPLRSVAAADVASAIREAASYPAAEAVRQLETMLERVDHAIRYHGPLPSAAEITALLGLLGLLLTFVVYDTAKTFLATFGVAPDEAGISAQWALVHGAFAAVAIGIGVMTLAFAWAWASRRRRPVRQLIRLAEFAAVAAYVVITFAQAGGLAAAFWGAVAVVIVFLAFVAGGESSDDKTLFVVAIVGTVVAMFFFWLAMDAVASLKADRVTSGHSIDSPPFGFFVPSVRIGEDQACLLLLGHQDGVYLLFRPGPSQPPWTPERWPVDQTVLRPCPKSPAGDGP
jgi:hypothetical protein